MVAQPPACLAALDMAAEPLGATRLDRAQRPVLHWNQAVCGLIRCPKACEDLGQFDLYPCRIRPVRMRAHGALVVRGARSLQQIERRGGAGQVLLRQMEVARRGGEIAVSQQALNGVHINTAFQQVRGKRVA